MAVFGSQIALLRRVDPAGRYTAEPESERRQHRLVIRAPTAGVVIASSVLSELTQQIWAETAISPGQISLRIRPLSAGR
jgi:hypothetical protein